jgi:cell division septum initiation protein DivIVA
MPETTTPATELASQYIAQVTGDLEANVKEQERVSAEITTLQEQLAALQHDHGVLMSMHQALGITQAPASSTAESKSAAVPSPRRKKKADAAPSAKQKTRKSTAAPAKKAAGKPASKTADTAKAAQPTLVELIRRHLADLQEPRSAAEISTALGQAHPDRDIAAKVVRLTLEGLVAKSQAERTKQGRSVFYTAPAPKPTAAAQADAQPEDTDS